MQEFVTLAVVTGSGIKSIVLPICAAILMCSCAVKAVKLSFDDDFGKKVSFIASAVFSAIFVLIPDLASTAVVDLAKVALT
ncbi:hypothetical protein ACFWB1_26080 [Streptomyces goshikiensis]|uniref:hypothetical protein n=1 Tax=Streptomyces goshikiensis TaxID=1942 RepID=UPI0036D0078C